jgi:hypothetical protein
MSALMNRSSARLIAPENRTLAGLANGLVELGSLPLPDLNELLRLQMWSKAARQIKEMEEALRKYGRQPKFWSDDIEDYIAASRQIVCADSFAIAEDVVENVGAADAALVQQRLVRQFGELLQVWPEIRRGARQLRNRQGGLGKKI